MQRITWETGVCGSLVTGEWIWRKGYVAHEALAPAVPRLPHTRRTKWSDKIHDVMRKPATPAWESTQRRHGHHDYTTDRLENVVSLDDGVWVDASICIEENQK